jgi:hypothetical protein
MDPNYTNRLNIDYIRENILQLEMRTLHFYADYNLYTSYPD